MNEGTVDVLVDDHILGRLSLDYIDTGRLLDDGRDELVDVCNRDSQGWYNVFAALYDQETGDLAEEIGCGDPFDFPLLLHRMRLHPAIQRLEPFTLSQVAKIRGGASIFTMLDSVPSIPVKELASIGFAKVANSELYFFPCVYTSMEPAVDDMIPDAIHRSTTKRGCWLFGASRTLAVFRIKCSEDPPTAVRPCNS